MVDSNLCISFLTIENKGSIAADLRPLLGDWVFGCDICQEVCPYNGRPPQAVWPELLPQSGVGHYIDLLDLIKIKDQNEFLHRFEKSPVRRPKWRGLLRNGLVVLGNHLAAGHDESDKIIASLKDFVATQSDPILVEHASWALGQSPA